MFPPLVVFLSIYLTQSLVWLFGVLLRGTFACTSLHKVFNPKLTSWGAGTIFATKITHQEWISAFMIGWFFSTHYWSTIFGCDGPPGVAGGFEGVSVMSSSSRSLSLFCSDPTFDLKHPCILRFFVPSFRYRSQYHGCDYLVMSHQNHHRPNNNN